MHVPAIVRHENTAPFGVVLQTQHAAAARYEVPRVVERVESDDVSIQQRPQELLAFGKRPKDFGRWKRAVQEDPARHFVQPAAQQ